MSNEWPEARFANRSEAGQRLAIRLLHYSDDRDVIVLGLPRGGIPVAFEVASVINAPLDVFVVRKLGLPGHEELAMGAVASGGVRVLNPEVIEQVRMLPEIIESVTRIELSEVERREKAYRGDRPPLQVEGKKVILIDDGLATGASMRAAVLALRNRNPEKIVVAVPVAAYETCREFKALVDETVCAFTPEPFISVGLWFEDFSQTTDDEVRYYLDESQKRAFAA